MPLTIAKNLGPVVTLAAVFGLVGALYRREFTAFRARKRRNHVVVCGLGEKGLRITRAFLRDGCAVTCIDLDDGSDAASDARGRGALVLKGDATQLHALTTARIDRASHVVCACPEDSANAWIAAEAVRQASARSRDRLNIFVHIENAELAALLEGPTLMLSAVRLEFFNIYELWGRAMADEGWDDVTQGGPPQVVVIGCTPLGRAVATAVARRWHQGARVGGSRILVTLVDAQASAHRDSLEMQYPALSRAADLRSFDHPVSAANPVDIGTVVDAGGGEIAVFHCLYDDAENVSLALQSRYRLPSNTRVVVPATAWTANLTGLLLDPSTRIQSVGYSDDPDSLDLISDSGREALARAIHDDYRRGNPSVAANVPWSSLNEDLREANRSQVDGIRWLASLWYEFAPRADWDTPVVQLTPKEVEVLARHEHERWCEERRQRGWQYDPIRCDPRKLHDRLVPWSELSEDDREKDRDAVRNWPKILADLGFDLRRSSERDRLAELIYTRHREARLSTGDGDVKSLRPWRDLDEQERDLNRASADDIAIKLEHIGARIVPAFDDSPPLTFTSDEVEQLAELEHARWCRTRQDGGWIFGRTRDDEGRRHPDLVPWAQLPHPRREIDRQHVCLIPELLSDVGLKAIRTT